MSLSADALLLVLVVGAVGILHTAVPDHWAPITLLARQRGWSRGQAMRVAMGAGVGHTVSTLALATIFWIAGTFVAQRFGHTLNLLSSLALVTFGGWIAYGAWRELREHATGEAGHLHQGHLHAHRHSDGTVHHHWHEHHALDWHEIGVTGGAVALHEHAHAASSRTALLLILGSSPMLEGVPAFFAAAKYGAGQLALMAAVFAASTILTYAVLVAVSLAGLQRVNLGAFERYGELLSGLVVVLVGIVFAFVPI